MQKILLILFSIIQITTLASTPKEYIQKYKKWAIEEMKITGIPASIKLAQGLLESNSGKSYLATKGKNHFGIKCKRSWKGKKIYWNDDAPNECFRKYKTVFDSYKDHSKFLQSNKRYEFLFNYKSTDYKAWAYGLKKAGYATAKDYAHKLIRIIKRENLNQYDEIIESKEMQKDLKKITSKTVPENIKKKKIKILPRSNSQRKVLKNYGIKYIIIRDEDTLLGLKKEFDISVKRFLKYNDLRRNRKLKIGQIFYLNYKNKTVTNKIYHLASGDEALYDISQHYAIRLAKLKKFNPPLSIYKKLIKDKKIYLQ